MTPMLFDLIVIALVVLSAAIGFMRGFCNEVFTIFGWIGAALATIYFTPVARDFGRTLIEKTWLADLATAAAIFLVTLGIFSGVSYFLTRTLHQSKLGILDRSMGFAFGLLRAVVLFGLGFLLFAYVFSPESRPAFVTEARTRPALEASATWVQALLPGESDIRVSSNDPLPEQPAEEAPAADDMTPMPNETETQDAE